MQICSFLWVYYGYPATDYEGINVEFTRNKCGSALARNDEVEIDFKNGLIKDKTSGIDIKFNPLPDFALEIIEAGGLLNKLAQKK